MEQGRGATLAERRAEVSISLLHLLVFRSLPDFSESCTQVLTLDPIRHAHVSCFLCSLLCFRFASSTARCLTALTQLKTPITKASLVVGTPGTEGHLGVVVGTPATEGHLGVVVGTHVATEGHTVMGLGA